MAQDSLTAKSKTFDFGIRHGYSHFNLRASEYRYDKINLYAGLFVETNISDKLGIRLETNYSHHSLLEVPLLLKYQISDKFEIYGGAELSYSFHSNTNSFNADKEFGGALILGLQYNINSHWFIDARYKHGFTDQFAMPFDFNHYGKSRTVSVGVGFKF
ncbi:outer membrane beta-barrel protein [uncultured Winogradskyella sp.]|uniref:outer membrane beta-barrel protein n=1 Tax=uncultured Winogradskyella sp. TaxID=395353 RepID=UPI00260E019F|nr:outer membrane beta-barrel protein [uncultured Winogradskyella sp.]